MLYKCWLLQKTEREKLFVVPNTVRRRPERGLSVCSLARESRSGTRYAFVIGCSLHRRNARAFRTDIDGQLLHSIHLHLTPSKVEFRCKLGGCYDDDSSSAPRVPSRSRAPAHPRVHGMVFVHRVANMNTTRPPHAIR